MWQAYIVVIDQTLYTAAQFKKWYVGERLEGARVSSEPVDDLLELAELTANFMVMNAKFDRRVDEDWGVVKVILAHPLLAAGDQQNLTNCFIEHFWSRLTESVEAEIENSGNSRPRLMKTVAGLDTNSSRSYRAFRWFSCWVNVFVSLLKDDFPRHGQKTKKSKSCLLAHPLHLLYSVQPAAWLFFAISRYKKDIRQVE